MRASSVEEIAREVVRVATTPASVEERARELLGPLSRLIPFQAAWIALADHAEGHYVELTSTGHDLRTRTYLSSPECFEFADSLGHTRSSTPTCARDSPLPVCDQPLWRDYYLPAGLREGVGVGLFTPNGQHLGLLALLTEDVPGPTDEERDLIGVLAHGVALAVNPMRSVTALATLVRDAEAGILLTRSGGARPIPGLPGHALLAAGSPLLAVALRYADEFGSESFCWPEGAGPDGRERIIRVTVLNCPPRPPELVAVVTLSPLADGPGLGRRELAILGCLLDGWSDREIAIALDAPVLMTMDVIAHIAVRIGAPDRHTALVRAARRGWYIPHLRGATPGW